MGSRSTANPFFDIWFPKNSQNITIVAPPSYDGLSDAELTSPNYALLDRLGDRDSIYSMGKLLSRRYPNAVIHLLSSEDFSRQTLSRNLVILGGPGGIQQTDQKSNEPRKPEPLDGNEACRMFIARVGSRFSYSRDCERLVVGNREHASSYDPKGYLVKDYGVFAAFPNPHLKSTRIVMLHGIHTLGVLGATRILEGNLDSMANFQVLQNAIGGQPDGLATAFECFFEVDVMHGEVECPSLKEDQVFKLEKASIRTSSEVRGKDVGPRQVPIISVDDLKQESIALVRIAEQQTISSNKEGLNRLLIRIQGMKEPTLEVMQTVLEICRRNSRIPPENVTLILGTIDNAGA